MLVGAIVVVGNLTVFGLISAVKLNLLADVLNAPWNSNRWNDGQTPHRVFQKQAKGEQLVSKLVFIPSSKL
jgi:hypothetical protein